MKTFHVRIDRFACFLLVLFLMSGMMPLSVAQTTGTTGDHSEVGLGDGSVSGMGLAAFDFGEQPMRYLENDRIKLGIDLSLGGAVTYLSDENNGGENMINSVDWGRQIQLSFYSGPRPFIGPNGEKPTERWAGLGWNPIQSGDVGGNKANTTAFEYRDDRKSMYVRCVPMQWPHDGVPGDCEFECLYTLDGNVIKLQAKIINHRRDKTQYPAGGQEMPALYTNGPWYKLVTYLGEKPFQNEPVTVVVDKTDGKGWPWVHYVTPERWSALMDEQGNGIGVYQPKSVKVTAGFHGGDANKGHGGEKSGQTGYIAPLGHQILDHDITWGYDTYFVLGTVEDVRNFAKKMTPANPRPTWKFENSRDDWYYGGGAKDAGWPIQQMLDVQFPADGKLNGPDTFWKAEDAPILEIEGAFQCNDPAAASGTGTLLVRLQPFGKSDVTDWLGWSEGTHNVEKERAAKAEQYPRAESFDVPLEVTFDGINRVYRVDLSKEPKYHGPMKNLTIQFPSQNGTAKIKRIGFVQEKSTTPTVLHSVADERQFIESPEQDAIKNPAMRWADTSRKFQPDGTAIPYSKDPCVVRFQDRYLMYFSLPPNDRVKTTCGWIIGIAESSDLVHWKRIAELPPMQECDAKGLCAPCARVWDGKVHLFYQTYGNGKDDAICYAFSHNGVDFTPHPQNPVFRPHGDWTCGRAIDADVFRFKDKLFLYAATRDPDMKIQKLVVATADPDSDYGPDCWTQAFDGAILEPELPWETKCIEAATVCQRGDQLVMFYAGGYNNDPQQIGVAVSDDGIRWTRMWDVPFLPNGNEESWNRFESGHPGVFVDDDGQTYLFYQGNNDKGKTWFLSCVKIDWDGNRPRIASEFN